MIIIILFFQSWSELFTSLKWPGASSSCHKRYRTRLFHPSEVVYGPDHERRPTVYGKGDLRRTGQVLHHLRRRLESHQRDPQRPETHRDSLAQPSNFGPGIQEHYEQEQTKTEAVSPLLCQKANVPTKRPGCLDDLPAFEEALHVQIAVIAASLGNKFIRVPTNDHEDWPIIYLYLVDHEVSATFTPSPTLPDFSRLCISAIAVSNSTNTAQNTAAKVPV